MFGHSTTRMWNSNQVLQTFSSGCHNNDKNYYICYTSFVLKPSQVPVTIIIKKKYLFVLKITSNFTVFLFHNKCGKKIYYYYITLLYGYILEIIAGASLSLTQFSSPAFSCSTPCPGSTIRPPDHYQTIIKKLWGKQKKT